MKGLSPGRIAAALLLVGACGAQAAERGQAQADLSITKSNGVNQVLPNSTSRYTIVASNAGPGAAAARVFDQFPAQCISANYTCSGSGGGICAPLGSSPINEIVSLPAGASVTYNADCGVGAVTPGQISNTATIAPEAGTVDPNPGNNSATDTDLLGEMADVMVVNSDNRSTAAPGAQLVYTIRVLNQGQTGVNGVSVSDTFPPNCLPDSWTCTGVGGAVCPASGTGDLTAAVNLPVGSFATFLARCTIPANAAPGTLTNTATATLPPGVLDLDPANNSATDTTDILGVANLSATKTVSGNYTIGSTVTYTVVISNNGTGPQGNNPGDEFVDWLEPNLQLVSASASSGSATVNPALGQVSWNGAIAAGASVTLTINAIIGPGALGTVANIGLIYYDSDANGTNNRQVLTDDPSQPGSQDPTTFVVNVPTRLTAKMNAYNFGTGYVQGGDVYYLVRIDNSGNAQADNPGDEFVDVLPAGLRVDAVQANVGTAAIDRATNTVRWNGAIPAHGVVSFIIAADIDLTTLGAVSNQASVNYDSNGDGTNDTVILTDDPSQPGANDPAVINVVAVPTRVTSTKAVYGDRHPRGKRLPYLIRLDNAGSIAQPDNPGDEMVDILPRGLDFVAARATAGVVAYDAATRRLSWNGVVPPYSAVAVELDVVVSADASGVISNQATVYYDADGDGSNESTALSDDPQIAGTDQPARFSVIAPVPGPGLPALLLLALGLLLGAGWRLRGRAAG
ncbi:DUF11 domain-containing protein [Tahibacter harae]|uniref:DUF11 domain-containing protein n=1 Tax=Tahibacter harae TaxID=2963937 RepID=A0ABT1QVL8_9GAMM|nr:DUF11 domain-containing protein [Tahibacter harae]MCQ4166325.1 DUF11 domain-containing protein [Tahibacter harae]